MAPPPAAKRSKGKRGRSAEVQPRPPSSKKPTSSRETQTSQAKSTTPKDLDKGSAAKPSRAAEASNKEQTSRSSDEAAQAKSLPRTEVPQKVPPKSARKPPKSVPNDRGFVGRRVAKSFDDEWYLGTVTYWTPPDMSEEGIDLWRVVYDDDDQEDFELVEVKKYLGLYEEEKANGTFRDNNA
jgi:hypothetical protein